MISKKNDLRQGKPRLLSLYIRKLVEPLVKKRGLGVASISFDWPLIMGSRFAQLCQVEKIYFLKGKKGCLYLKAPSSMALTLSYEKKTIIERVNQFYGNDIIDDLRITHSSILSHPAIKKTKVIEKTIPTEDTLSIESITDKLLKKSLHQLGVSLYQKDAHH